MVTEHNDFVFCNQSRSYCVPNNQTIFYNRNKPPVGLLTHANVPTHTDCIVSSVAITLQAESDVQNIHTAELHTYIQHRFVAAVPDILV